MRSVRTSESSSAGAGRSPSRQDVVHVRLASIDQFGKPTFGDLVGADAVAGRDDDALVEIAGAQAMGGGHARLW